MLQVMVYSWNLLMFKKTKMEPVNRNVHERKKMVIFLEGHYLRSQIGDKKFETTFL